MKTSTILIVISALNTSPCFSEAGNESAGEIDDLIQTEYPENDLPEDWDTRPPEPGKIRLLAVIALQQSKKSIENELAAVPDGANGKGNVLYAKITEWLQKVQPVLQNKTRGCLLELKPLHAEILALSQSEEDVEISVLDLVGQVQATAKALIYNAADFYQENQNPTIVQHDQLLAGFCEPLFVEMPEWEDEPLPIDPAGIFIIDQNNATTKLKTKTLAEINTFLGGATDHSFFERYEVAGDGMNTLKARYAANKAAIHAKFAEVLAHVAQLENQ